MSSSRIRAWKRSAPPVSMLCLSCCVWRSSIYWQVDDTLPSGISVEERRSSLIRLSKLIFHIQKTASLRLFSYSQSVPVVNKTLSPSLFVDLYICILLIINNSSSEIASVTGRHVRPLLLLWLEVTSFCEENKEWAFLVLKVAKLFPGSWRWTIEGNQKRTSLLSYRRYLVKSDHIT